MSSHSGFLGNLLALVALGILLVLLAMGYDSRLDRLELLERAPTATPLLQLPGGLRDVASGQTVYVPVYSHVYAGGGAEHLLEATLSIRNADLEREIVVRSIRYHGTEGELLREYLEVPVRLPPLASTDFLVEYRDTSGGAGANFLVDWVAQEKVVEPIIEAVMVKLEGSRAFAFVRPGYPIATFSGPAAPDGTASDEATSEEATADEAASGSGS